ncbi:MAG: hypothetical protein AABX27_00750 [Nanoarchaeota archaeon]
MADEYKSAREELTAKVSREDKFSLIAYLTPEERNSLLTPEQEKMLREKAVEMRLSFYQPMLQKLDSKYHVEFIRFTQTGEASPEFMAYIDDEKNTGAQEAVDMAMEKQADALRELGRELRKGSLETQVEKGAWREIKNWFLGR